MALRLLLRVVPSTPLLPSQTLKSESLPLIDTTNSLPIGASIPRASNGPHRSPLTSPTMQIFLFGGVDISMLCSWTYENIGLHTAEETQLLESGRGLQKSDS